MRDVAGSCLMLVGALAGCGSRDPVELRQPQVARAPWVAQAAPVRLNGVWGFGSAERFAVGEQGTILHTLDDGIHWDDEPSGTASELAAVWATDSLNVYVAGAAGEVLYYSGTGVWTLRPTGGAGDIHALAGLREQGEVQPVQTVVAGADDALYVSLETGQPWRAAELEDSGPSGGISSIVGYEGVGSYLALGHRGTDVVALASSDGGTSWGRVALPAGFSPLCGAVASREYLVYVLGENGEVLSSSDRAQSWDTHSIPSHGVPRSLSAAPTSDDVWVVGDAGLIAHGTAGASSWQIEDSGVTADLHSVWVADSGEVWIVGDYVILHRDG